MDIKPDNDERYTPEDWVVLRQAEDLVSEFEKIIAKEQSDG